MVHGRLTAAEQKLVSIAFGRKRESERDVPVGRKLHVSVLHSLNVIGEARNSLPFQLHLDWLTINHWLLVLAVKTDPHDGVLDQVGNELAKHVARSRRNQNECLDVGRQLQKKLE